MLRRPIIQALAIAAVLALLAAGLAYLSRSTTERRVYYGVPPFALQVDVADGRGEPVPRPALRLVDAAGAPVPGYLVYNALPPDGLVGDERGRVTLHFAGYDGEFEEWRLFWLFRQAPYEPEGLQPYAVEIAADGWAPQRVPLLDLMHTEAGTAPAPKGGPQVPRYNARVTLARAAYP